MCQMLFSLNYRHNLLELLTLALVQQDPTVSFPEPQLSTLRWVISISILWFTLFSCSEDVWDILWRSNCKPADCTLVFLFAFSQIEYICGICCRWEQCGNDQVVLSAAYSALNHQCTWNWKQSSKRWNSKRSFPDQGASRKLVPHMRKCTSQVRNHLKILKGWKTSILVLCQTWPHQWLVEDGLVDFLKILTSACHCLLSSLLPWLSFLLASAPMGEGDTIAWPDEPCDAPCPQPAHTLVSGRGAPFPWPATAPADGNACESKQWHFQGSFQKERGIRTSTSSTQKLSIDGDAHLLVQQFQQWHCTWFAGHRGVSPPRPQLSRKDAVQWVMAVLQEQIEKNLTIEDDRRGGDLGTF